MRNSKKMAHFLFFILSLVCVGAVVGMIFSKNQAYNALLLVLTFAALGGLFGLLNAPFIAAIQIIIYAGAIMVLFIFVIMMLNLSKPLPPEKKKWTMYLSLGLAVILIAEFILAVKGSLQGLDSGVMTESAHPARLGKLLFTKYLYPFEITSILIIAALVGAIILVKKKENE